MNITTTYPIIEVGGTPYQCGEQYGRAAKRRIRANLDLYLQLLQHSVGLDRKAALEKAQQFLPEFERYDSDMIVEMQGIADGAGISLAEVVLINTRTELMAAVPLHECTTIAVLPSASSGDMWLAQNWDWFPAAHDTIIVLKVAQTGKPELTMVVEAGQIGKPGLNEAGIGLCLNWLLAGHRRIGVPILAILRGVLNSAHIDDAINAVYTEPQPRASAANVMIAYKEAFAIDLELTPSDVAFLEPVNGLLVHTNHFVAPRLRPVDCGIRDRGGSSLVRRQRAQYLLEQETRIDETVIDRVLDDVVLGPSSRYLNPQTDKHLLEQWVTLVRIITNLSTGEMHITDPCASD